MIPKAAKLLTGEFAPTVWASLAKFCKIDVDLEPSSPDSASFYFTGRLELFELLTYLAGITLDEAIELARRHQDPDSKEKQLRARRAAFQAVFYEPLAEQPRHFDTAKPNVILRVLQARFLGAHPIGFQDRKVTHWQHRGRRSVVLQIRALASLSDAEIQARSKAPRVSKVPERRIALVPTENE